MTINNTDEELEQLVNAPTLKDKEIQEMMKNPTKEELNKSIKEEGVGMLMFNENIRA